MMLHHPHPNRRLTKRVLAIAVTLGVGGFALGAELGALGPADAAVVTYWSGNVLPNAYKWDNPSTVKGGTFEGTIGTYSTGRIQTVNVFGSVVFSADSPDGAYTTLTHGARFDARSRCWWAFNYSPAPSTTGYTVCRRSY
jgi:hypothetical protein